MHTRVVTPPATEPLTLNEIKLHLKLAITAEEATAYTDEDALLTIYQKAARASAEDYCWRKFISTGLQTVTTAFCRTMDLPYPALAITTVQYTDANGATQTVSSNDYSLDNYTVPSRVIFKSTYTFPTVNAETPFPVIFNYTSGYSALAADIPSEIKSAMLLMIGEMYEKREDRVFKLPTASQYLLNPHRLWRF
jgi:uncharacterized phiE125 gp8 family phage protein